MKHKESYNRDPLVKAAEGIMVTEDVAKIKKKVAQLKVGDKTNYGTVKEIGADSITFKALHTPKTKIAFRQRKIGRPDYILMNLVKFTDDGKKLDKTFKEANDFTGAAAAAKVAGKDEFEFEGETYPVTISLDVAKKIMSQSLELAKALAKKEESIDLEERVGSLQNSLKVLSKAGIKGRAISDMPKFAQAIHKNYKDITGEKYQDADQVAMSEIIADIIGYFRLDGEDFIDAWDNTIKEEAEISETKRMKYDKVIKKLRDGEWESSDDVKQGNHLNYTDNNTGKKKVVFVEATEFVKGDRVMDVRTKLKGTVLHKGNKDEVYVDLGAIKKAISSKNLRLVESTELEESKSSTGYELYHRDFSSAMAHAYEFAKKKYRIEVDPDEITDKVALGPKRPSKGKTNRYRLLGKDGRKAIHVQVYGMDSGKYELNMYKEGLEEEAELEEAEAGEWFTAEMKVKSSGQLYSTFYVQAKDMSQAKKKADNVFIELMKTSYPKSWPTYQRKFTLKVMPGDNMGDLMP